MRIELEAVAARHPAAKADVAPALQALDLSIAQGEQVAIIGPSGAGKTTLMHVLACALAPSAGRLLLDGRDPWRLPVRELQRLRGRLFLAPQTPPLPPRQRVNRSLSARELALMRMLNHQLGARGGGWGGRLQNDQNRASRHEKRNS